MQKNDILKTANGVFRILSVDEKNSLAINCKKELRHNFFPFLFSEWRNS